MTMETDIRNAIEKLVTDNLPQHVSETLRKELAALEQLRVENQMLKDKNDVCNKEVIEVRREITVVRDENSRLIGLYGKYEQDRAALDTQMRDLELTLVKKDLALANTRVEDHRQMLHAAFKNPTYREFATTNENGGSNRSVNGVQQGYDGHSSQKTSTVTREVE